MKRFCALLLLLSLLPLFPFPAKAGSDHAIKRVECDEKLIALTFDDGPHPQYTEEILDILKEYGQKATFFVVGQNAKEHPEILCRAVREGHEIGEHTYSHGYINRMSDEQLISDMEKTEAAIREACGVTPLLIRPPGGGYNDHTLRIIEERGKLCVLWNRDTRDWQLPSVQTVLSRLEGNLTAGDIILFHDYNRKNSPTPDILRQLIPHMLEQGYRFVTVTELLNSKKATQSDDCAAALFTA